MNARESMLRTIRDALGRTRGTPVPPLPPVWLKPVASIDRAALFTSRLEALLGNVHRVARADATAKIRSVVGDRTSIASDSPLLAELGLLPVRDRNGLKNACASVDVGITGAEYGLAATGSLVMLSSVTEARMLSLLPPAHIAVLETRRLLADIDELFTIVPHPSLATSSMVLITGPSRTGDIEQISIRGVHGPGELHVVLIDG